jgi:hypothetical protein
MSVGSNGMYVKNNFTCSNNVTVSGTTNTNTLQFANLNAGYGRISHWNFGTNGDWYIRSVNTAGKVVIQDTGGYVGIGTLTPSSALDVVGSIKASSNLTASNIIENSVALINKYALSNTLSNFALISTLSNYAPSNTLSNYTLTSTANSYYAPSNTLSNYLLSSTANTTYAKSNALSNYTLTSIGNSQYAPSNTMSNYLLTAAANTTYAKSNTLSNYTLTSVGNSQYAPSNILSNLQLTVGV